MKEEKEKKPLPFPPFVTLQHQQARIRSRILGPRAVGDVGGVPTWGRHFQHLPQGSASQKIVFVDYAHGGSPGIYTGTPNLEGG